MQYSNYGYRNYPRYDRPRIKKDVALGARLEKVAKENLNESSSLFVKSLIDFYGKNGGLSDKQLAAFVKIESRFSPQEQAKLARWATDYKQQHLGEAKILAAYYVKTGYWNEIAKSIMSDPEYLPDRTKYQKMRNNKYAKKLLAETRKTARFDNQSMIQIRRNAAGTVSASLLNRLCFVLKNDLPIKNPVVGGKRYLVLPMSTAQPIEVEERYMMKPNKNGVSK